MKNKITMLLTFVFLGWLSLHADGTISYKPFQLTIGNESLARQNRFSINGFNALHWEYGKCMLHFQLANYSKALISSNHYIDFYNHHTKTPNDIYCMWLMTVADPPRVETPDYYDDDDAMSRIAQLQPVMMMTSKGKAPGVATGYGFAGGTLAKAMPELVGQTADGRETYDAVGLISLLAKGVQETTESILENDLKLSIIKERIATKKSVADCLFNVEYANNCLTVVLEDCGCESDLRKVHISNAEGILVKSFDMTDSKLSIDGYRLTTGLTFVSYSVNGKVIHTLKIYIDN